MPTALGINTKTYPALRAGLDYFAPLCGARGAVDYSPAPIKLIAVAGDSFLDILHESFVQRRRGSANFCQSDALGEQSPFG